jgi:mannose-6-phosphate isomerase-like protein (cupin superfamily)
MMGSGEEPRLTMSSKMTAVVSRARASLAAAGLTVVGVVTRPWGGFLLIAQTEVSEFIRVYFPNTALERTTAASTVSPKILLVAPACRLSWQYHLKRSEVWRIIERPVGISRGFSDKETAMRSHGAGEVLRFELGERHRLTGLKKWGVVAEIWQHTDTASPSNERDIVRIADDYDRT